VSERPNRKISTGRREGCRGRVGYGEVKGN